MPRHIDLGIRIPLIADTVERDIAEPARSIGSLLDEIPVLIVVDVWLAIRPECVSDQQIMEGAQMHVAVGNGAVDLFLEPAAEPMPCRRVPAIRSFCPARTVRSHNRRPLALDAVSSRARSLPLIAGVHEPDHYR